MKYSKYAESLYLLLYTSPKYSGIFIKLFDKLTREKIHEYTRGKITRCTKRNHNRQSKYIWTII